MKKQIILFALLVILLSWTAAALFYLLNGDLQTTAGFVFMTGYMFFPLISVVIVQAIHKEPILKGLGVSFKLNRWFVVAWLLPVVINVVHECKVRAKFGKEFLYLTQDGILQIFF